MNSTLEFKLHRLKFVTLLDSGMLQEALQYSKLFGHFANKHKKGTVHTVIFESYISQKVSLKGFLQFIFADHQVEYIVSLTHCFFLRIKILHSANLHKIKFMSIENYYVYGI